MCGIVGYVGKKDGERATSVILEGLRKLEPRGYDSAGIAIGITAAEGLMPHLVVHKAVKGRISAREQIIEELRRKPISGVCWGQGHTRWATHGRPTIENAHPIKDCEGNICVSLNGQIDNYLELREELEGKGHKFVTENDTEVIAHLVEEQFTSYDCATLEQAVWNAVIRFRGRFGIIVMHRDFQNMLVVARQSSPIIIGYGHEEYFVASSKRALEGFASETETLKNGQLATITADGVFIHSFRNERVERTRQILESKINNPVEKQGYAHHMLKEIHEEKAAVESAIHGRLNMINGDVVLGGDTFEIADELAEKKNVYVLGCGTSHYAGILGALALRRYAGYRASAHLAEEFLTGEHVLDPQTDFVVVVSQSGETADTIKAMEYAQWHKVKVFGIVNCDDSYIADNDDAGIFINSGDEIAVASTKTFVAQIMSMLLLSIFLAKKRKKMDDGSGRVVVATMANISSLVRDMLKQDVSIPAQKIAKWLAENRRESMLILGRNHDFPIALELALKLKEIAYVHAEAYQSAEMKHGPIALIGEGYPVIVIANQGTDIEKTYNTLSEVRARGAKTLVFGDYRNQQLRLLADWFIPILNTTVPTLQAVVTAPAIHLFAYQLAIAMEKETGVVREIDQPKSLAKSVTV